MNLPKKLIAAAALLALTGATYAQEASPQPTPEPQALQASPAPEKRFYLELTQEDLNAVSAALIELPKRVADPLILKFNGQLQKQDEIRKRAEAEPPKKVRK